MSERVLIYGATGYTGALVAREAAGRGLRPVLAGRDEERVRQLADGLGLPWRAFPLGDPARVAEGLAGAAVVLHCAGPFRETSAPMAAACLRAGVHYLDITGEVAVFEALAARDAAARQAGVMLLPGVGFDVVPTDCLAAHLKARLPSATHLALAIGGSGGVSRGTAITALGGTGYGAGGLVRRDGALTPVPVGALTRTIDLGGGPRPAQAIPWGDLATAYRSTGIPNIETYLAGVPAPRLPRALTRLLEAAVGSYAGRRLAQELVRRRVSGPTDEQRARGKSRVWGEVTDGAGRRAVSRLLGPEAYTLTVLAALAIVERVLAGEARPGFQTPATAYGPNLILSIPGVTRTDEEGLAPPAPGL